MMVGHAAAWTFETALNLMGTADSDWWAWTQRLQRSDSLNSVRLFRRHAPAAISRGCTKPICCTQQLPTAAACSNPAQPSRTSPDPAHSRASARALARPARGPITRDLDSYKTSTRSHLRVVSDELLQSELESQPLSKWCKVPDCHFPVGMRKHQYMPYCNGHGVGDWTGLPPEDPDPHTQAGSNLYTDELSRYKKASTLITPTPTNLSRTGLRRPFWAQGVAEAPGVADLDVCECDAGPLDCGLWCAEVQPDQHEGGPHEFALCEFGVADA